MTHALALLAAVPVSWVLAFLAMRHAARWVERKITREMGL